jgi:hypothetical protein
MSSGLQEIKVVFTTSREILQNLSRNLGLNFLPYLRKFDLNLTLKDGKIIW